ncbi:MAG: hypothetical protein LBD29_07700 [Treponema sp.]|jgi:hypothetical protein|nr:hypothetical protein [Treponema sp.]
MLYPKSAQEFTPEDFKRPGSEYRAAPFWAWNNKLDPAELTWQIERLKELGFGGFHMHVRTGLATEYLSDEYMENIRVCVEKARSEGMLAWLYDEDRWPSGAAGGLVTKNPQYRIRHLLVTRRAYQVSRSGQGGVSFNGDSSAAAERSENGKLAAVFDVVLDQTGDLASYRRIDPEASAQGFKLYAYIESPGPSPWFNNQTYVNTLDPESIQEFIKITYKRYEHFFSKDFGGVIPAIFTDEPQFAKKGTLNFAQEEKDVILPWTDNINETFTAAYPGENLIEGIPELLWDLPQGKVSVIRYHYHDHIAERFVQAFADQCGSWCAAHRIMLTGHMMEEPTLETQTHSLGEAMRSYRSFQLPGIDILCDRREFTTAKQAQSAARQYGRPGVLSELYGVTNWDYDFRGHKLQGDWQAALGVTVRVPHLSWVSMNGDAKRDYPGTFNYQAPWYKEYPYVEDHFARVASVLTRGKALVRVGVIHPVESYWLHWGSRENTAAIREEMDQRFQDLCTWLLRGTIDFDYICESLLPEIGDQNGVKLNRSGKPLFPVGEMGYEVIIVPALETIRRSTLERLEAFRKAGGRIIFLGDPPKYVEAQPDPQGADLWKRSETLSFERLRILNALSDIKDIEIREENGSLAKDFLYQLREEGDNQWLFIAHADNPVNPDIPTEKNLHIRLQGEWLLTYYNTISGEISGLPGKCNAGQTFIDYRFYDHDSLLLKLEPSRSSLPCPGTLGPKPSARVGKPRLFIHDPVPVRLQEPNVLLLDMPEYALNNSEWREREEILRLHQTIKQELGWASVIRGAQPWVERDSSTPHTLRLRYCFESEIPIKGACLGLENAVHTKVTLNGEAAGNVNGWYVDKSIGAAPLPDIRAGKNVLELAFPFGPKTPVERVYLFGDFGVSVAGTAGTLTEPVRSLAFGDITRQGLPFYGGAVSYYLDAESRGGSLTITAASYRAHLLKVLVDGKDRGIIAYSPYRLEVPHLADGLHRIELICFGNRINTFGQLHANIRDSGFWWGPPSWYTQGDAWTYEYRFWTQGILKSPEIT